MKPSPTRLFPGAEEDDGWKILIVDDEADVHSVTVYMLAGQKFHGHSIFCTPTAIRKPKLSWRNMRTSP